MTNAIDKLKCPKCGDIGGCYCEDLYDDPDDSGYYIRCWCGHYLTNNCWFDSSGPYEEAETLLAASKEKPLEP